MTDVKKLLGTFIQKHRAGLQFAIKSREWYVRWSFDRQRQLQFIQARLLALLHPEEVERALLDVVDGPETLSEDLLFGIQLLGVLAQEGRRSSEAALIRLASGKNLEVVWRALEMLAGYDTNGARRRLYLTQATTLSYELLSEGPYDSDRETEQLLQGLRAANQAPEKAHALLCTEQAYERFELLKDAAGHSRLELILGGQDLPGDTAAKSILWTPWALTAVRLNSDKTVIPILRTRLDKDEAAAGAGLDFDLVPLKVTEQGYAHSTEDQFFDEVLLTYQTLGGTLNGIEKTRLTYYGYLGDRQTRLQSLLAEDDPK